LHTKNSKTLLPTHRLVLRSHVGHQPEEDGTDVADLLNKLKDLMEQQKRILREVNEVVSRLQKAPDQSSHRRLPNGGRSVKWAYNASAHGPKDGIGPPRKRVRESS
jgi:hypothetical protein